LLQNNIIWPSLFIIFYPITITSSSSFSSFILFSLCPVSCLLATGIYRVVFMAPARRRRAWKCHVSYRMAVVNPFSTITLLRPLFFDLYSVLLNGYVRIIGCFMHKQVLRISKNLRIAKCKCVCLIITSLVWNKISVRT